MNTEKNNGSKYSNLIVQTLKHEPAYVAGVQGNL